VDAAANGVTSSGDKVVDISKILRRHEVVFLECAEEAPKLLLLADSVKSLLSVSGLVKSIHNNMAPESLRLKGEHDSILASMSKAVEETQREIGCLKEVVEANATTIKSISNTINEKLTPMLSAISDTQENMNHLKTDIERSINEGNQKGVGSLEEAVKGGTSIEREIAKTAVDQAVSSTLGTIENRFVSAVKNAVSTVQVSITHNGDRDDNGNDIAMDEILNGLALLS
jgi:ferritin-like metal-binding protein YciE